MNTQKPHEIPIGRTLQARAYAKLNLRLKIVGRRSDGFHLLSMLNNEISLADEISLTFGAHPGVSLESSGLGSGSDFFDAGKNLAARAASVYLREVGAAFGVRIRLQKNIPIGAGLGGGSSDAGAVLRLLQKEFGAKAISHERLLKLAAAIGSDVPYFLERGVCHVRGVGEQVRRLSAPSLHRAAVFLFVPALSIATPDLYAFYRKKHPVLEASIDDALMGEYEQSELPYHRILGLVENDFEALLREFAPGLWREISTVRSAGGLRVGLTGSGSAYFGIPENPTESSAQIMEHVSDLLRPSATKVLALRFVDADEG